MRLFTAVFAGIGIAGALLFSVPSHAKIAYSVCVELESGCPDGMTAADCAMVRQTCQEQWGIPEKPAGPRPAIMEQPSK